MSFLLDTCVLSELVRPKPNDDVRAWVGAQSEDLLCLSVITIGELHKGVSKLEPGRRRMALETWLEDDLLKRFHGRILPVDGAVARAWGSILGDAERRGRPVPALDALIAATARVHDCAVVTRNERDMEPTGVDVINPWS